MFQPGKDKGMKEREENGKRERKEGKEGRIVWILCAYVYICICI
jgi:hypothetical protein